METIRYWFWINPLGFIIAYLGWSFLKWGSFIRNEFDYVLIVLFGLLTFVSFIARGKGNEQKKLNDRFNMFQDRDDY